MRFATGGPVGARVSASSNSFVYHDLFIYLVVVVLVIIWPILAVPSFPSLFSVLQSFFFHCLTMDVANETLAHYFAPVG